MKEIYTKYLEDVRNLEVKENCIEKKSHKERMILTNLRLVISIAKRYTNKGLDIEDLTQEGNIGLSIAADKFNPDRNTKFSTYATFWIRQRIIRALNEQSKLIKIPAKLSIDNAKKWANNDELGDEINQHRNVLLPIISLSQVVSQFEENQSLEEKIPDKRLSQEDILCSLSNKDVVETLLDSLTMKERQVLELRFGLKDDRPRTNSDISKFFNVSSERVRQIEKKALKRLQLFVRSNQQLAYAAN